MMLQRSEDTAGCVEQHITLYIVLAQILGRPGSHSLALAICQQRCMTSAPNARRY